MGRKKLHRDVPLYTRIKEENNDYLITLCERAKVNKTDWMDRHLDYLRKNIAIRKAARLIEATSGTKARD